MAGAHATPVLQMDVNGKLTGATGVDVDGTLYDVQFLDGSCISLFSGCPLFTEFTFNTVPSAQRAGQALSEQVFLDGLHLFDTVPEATFGCELHEQCVILISAFYTGGLRAGGGVFWNSSVEASDGFGEFGIDIDFDTTFWRDAVYSVWSAHSVPSPATLPLLGIGLFALVCARHRRTLRV
jgi:hypothetical protein